jgi:hypothetical protein
VPEVLTDDQRLRDIIGTHPGLRWKALHVRQHRGIESDATQPVDRGE